MWCEGGVCAVGFRYGCGVGVVWVVGVGVVRS